MKLEISQELAQKIFEFLVDLPIKCTYAPGGDRLIHILAELPKLTAIPDIAAKSSEPKLVGEAESTG